MPERNRTVNLSGLRVNYVVEGSGPPVVLLHGGGLDSATLSWKETIPTLAENCTVYALDWPGYGESDPPDGAVSIPYYGDVVRRFLDSLDLESVSLGGISMGGGAALGFALDHPDRVEKLALVDSYGLGERIPGGSLGSLLGALFVRTPWLTGGIWDVMGSSRELARLVLTGVVGAGNLTDELVDDVFSELQRPNAGEAWQRFQRNEVGFSGLKTNYRRRLPELSVPTLLVHGEDDALVPVGWAVRAGTLAPSASVEVLRDCGHWPPREKSERFNSVVREFLGTA